MVCHLNLIIYVSVLIHVSFIRHETFVFALEKIQKGTDVVFRQTFF